MAKNLDSFIRELTKVAPEEISEVKKTVDPKFEATALLRKLELELTSERERKMEKKRYGSDLRWQIWARN